MTSPRERLHELERGSRAELEASCDELRRRVFSRLAPQRLVREHPLVGIGAAALSAAVGARLLAWRGFRRQSRRALAYGAARAGTLVRGAAFLARRVQSLRG